MGRAKVESDDDDWLGPKREAIDNVLAARMDAIRAELTDRWKLSEEQAFQFLNEHTDARRLNQSMKRSDMPRTVAAFKHAEREATAIAQVLSPVITLDRYERLRDRILVCPEIELASIDDALSTHDVFLRSARIGRRRQQMGEALGEAHAERWRAFDERVMKEARAVVAKHPEIRHQKDRSTKLIERALNRLPAARIETLNGGPLVTHEETEQFITRLKERLGARLSALFNAR